MDNTRKEASLDCLHYTFSMAFSNIKSGLINIQILSNIHHYEHYRSSVRNTI